jgi:hypothetical protein
MRWRALQQIHILQHSVSLFVYKSGGKLAGASKAHGGDRLAGLSPTSLVWAAESAVPGHRIGWQLCEQVKVKR